MSVFPADVYDNLDPDWIDVLQRDVPVQMGGGTYTAIEARVLLALVDSVGTQHSTVAMVHFIQQESWKHIIVGLGDVIEKSILNFDFTAEVGYLGFR